MSKVTIESDDNKRFVNTLVEPVKKITPEHRAITAPEGRKIIATGYCCWGSGKTVGEALDNIRKTGGRLNHGVIVREYDQSAQVLSDGSISWQPPCEPSIELFRKAPSKRT